MLRHHHKRKHIKPKPLPLHLKMLNKHIACRCIPKQQRSTPCLDWPVASLRGLADRAVMQCCPEQHSKNL
ncbi:MAG: hypothetical protein JKX70_11150 [Phycisphaerales bacterium]|nr:hypothetical protein [Phycisphaerales bacterium]